MKQFKNEKVLLILISILGVFSFCAVLARFSIIDYDLWARLAQGASIWNTGFLIHKDIFAFTPVLPEYIDHEWGSGLVFFSLLKFFGPGSLQFFRIITAIGSIIFALFIGRVNGARWPTLMLVAIPASSAVFIGYAIIIRSHALTYLFFSAALLFLELIRKGKKWPAYAMVALIALWANIHGGFVSGLGLIAVYAAYSIVSKKMTRTMITVFLSSVAATFINPYGVKLWIYLVPALLHPRKAITEWWPVPLWGIDVLIGFRALFICALVTIVWGWKGPRRRDPVALFIMILTAFLAIRHRRHVPFFGLSAAAFLWPYAENFKYNLALRLPRKIFRRADPMIAVLLIYALIAALALFFVLPGASLRVFVHTGFFPVRAVDILYYSKAGGNLVVPFGWGNYAMWRLYPRVKISICGRYETIYPDSTFDMNADFFLRRGENWDRIIRGNKVDFIILDLSKSLLKRDDLEKLGFGIVWWDGSSALFARKDMAQKLCDFNRGLPYRETPTLDARIPDSWWKS